ncbi:sulfotransferase family 2 domain-containing protein [Henriciella sp. AS95]|uniref:sulfotransferase family 2 domain-containing protein n=1 Tax=Henriciella sp. AS95 TaxID=3135782 RepID=UPI003170EC31
MPVFVKDDKKILYVHVPKTGGTNVNISLRRSGFRHALIHKPDDVLNGLRRCSPQHFHAEVLRTILKIELFDYIFVTVRHPLKRMLSEYRMRNGDPAIQSATHFDQFVEKCFRLYRSNPFSYDNHIRPQSEFLLSDAAVFKQEDGYDENWADKITLALGGAVQVKANPQGRANKTVKGKSFDVSPQTRRLIEDFYQSDYDLFSYATG